MNIKLKSIVLFIFVIYIYFNYFYVPYVFHYDSKKKGVNLFILGSVHGNEPAGTHSCYKLIEFIKQKKLKIKSGSITILPLPNPVGFYLNSRYQFKLDNSDINRNFISNGKDRISKIILTYVNKSNFVIDLHEGWGFHKLQNSLGSTITNTNSKQAKTVAKKMVSSINKKIKHRKCKFTRLIKHIDFKHCNPKGSLGCYCQKNKINYILIEISGQNDIQNLKTRVKQDIILLCTAISTLKIN